MKLLGLALACAAMAASSADAQVSLKLTGQIYYLTDDLKPFFSLGEMATAWFSYDPSSPGRAWYPGGVLDPTVYFYQNAPLPGGGMQIGNYAVSFDQNARMFVTNQEIASYGPIDRVLFDDFGAKGAPMAGRPLDVVSISFQDNSARALNNLALPDAASTFAAFPDVSASLDWQPYLGAEHRVSINFTSVEALAVPEPTGWATMISGLAVLGMATRRRRGLNQCLASALS